MLSDPLKRGLDYLYQVRSLALEPDLITLVYNLEERIPVCLWIDRHIDWVNSQLQACLQACNDCFYPWQQPSIQIFAAPFSDPFGLDGLCNLHTSPITILIDVGRIVPQDWIALVAHEYAHAYLASPGHHFEFVQTLTHLCLGLGLDLPTVSPTAEDLWRSFPPCRRTTHPLDFWRGQIPFPAQFEKNQS